MFVNIITPNLLTLAHSFVYVISILVGSYLGFFAPFRIMKPKSKYHCPRCKATNILEYDKFIECPLCLLDFDKDLIGKIPDNEIMAHREMGGILDGFEELKDSKKAKEVFDSIMKDLQNLNDSA